MGLPDPTSKSSAGLPNRLDSVDAFRGLVMFLMMAEILKFQAISRALPGSELWSFLAFHQSHVEWTGCALHDLIQPGFMFLVGVSLPFSLAARRGKGQSVAKMTLHAVWRAAVLIFLAIVLSSLGRETPDYIFTNVLAQIGLGYVFLFAVGFLPVRGQWLAFAGILLGYWLAFAVWPIPPADFDWISVGVKPDWLAAHGLTGFAAHWSKNANIATSFDLWFLNLFPRAEPFAWNRGGYQTLNFVPSLATMILGLIAGEALKSDRSPIEKLRWLVLAGVLALAAGYGLEVAGVCPIVKRIWTPSWVLFSGGWCLLFLAGFYAIMDIAGRKSWAFPLTVVGMNSIAAYCISTSFVKPEIHKGLRRHWSGWIFDAFGPEYATLVHGAMTLTVMWLILFWMYRRKIFLRI